MKANEFNENVKNVPIDQIVENEDNPRLITKKKFTKLIKSIKEFPEMLNMRPIVVNENQTILGGNMRYKACKEIGFTHIPVFFYTRELHKKSESWLVYKKTYEDVCVEFVIADNVPYGEWDYDILANKFDSYPLQDWGMDLWKEEEEEIGLTDEDAVPYIEGKAKTKRGDVWKLGNHRVMCGDSTKDEDVKKLMDGKKSDMVFTDPPYDIDNQDYSTLINDYTENSHIFVMHDDKGIVEYLRKSTLKFLRFFIADFTFSSPRGNDPYLNHIIISHESKGECIKHQNLFDGFSSIIKMKYRGTITNEDIFHKHQKPVDFVEKFINHFSIEESLVLDLFLGSGSTLIASEKLNRDCYGMELDAKFCDVVVKRWEDFTGKKAIRV